MNRRIVKLGLVIVLPLLSLPMLLGLECYTSDVFKTGEGTPDGPAGRLKWTFTVTTSFMPTELSIMYSSSAIASDGTIYVGSFDKYLYAVDINGNLVWKYKTGGEIQTSPSIGPDGTVYVGSADGNLYAFSPDGSQKWKISPDGGTVGPPAIDSDGTIYFTTQNDNLCSVSPQGSVNWQVDYFSGTLCSPPAIASDGNIYVYESTAEITAFDKQGNELWSFDTDDPIIGALAIGSDGTIYYQEGLFAALCALDPASQTLKWRYPFTDVIDATGPAIASDGTIYFVSEDGVVYAFSPYGEKKWECDTDTDLFDLIHITPAVGSDGVIYFGTCDGYVVAVNPDGTLAWKYLLGEEPMDDYIRNSVNIASDGTIVVGSDADSCYLHAIEGSSNGLASSSWPKYNHDQRNTGRQGG